MEDYENDNYDDSSDDEEDYSFEPPMGFGEMVSNFDVGTSEEVAEEEQGTVSEDVVNEAEVEVVDTATPEPTYVDNDWVPPENADINWYKEKYAAINEALTGAEFVQKIKDAHLELMTAQEADVEQFRSLYKAYKEGDVDFLRLSFPDELVKIGINPILKESEIDNEIESILQAEFGDNYADIYDVRELVRPSSISAKIYNRSQQLAREFEQENINRQEAYNQYVSTKQQPTQTQAVPLDYDELYKPFEQELKRDEFDHMVDTIKKLAPSWTLADYRKLLTYEDDLARARAEGAEAERAKLTGDLRKTGHARPMSNRVESTRDNEPVEIDTKFGRDFNDIFRQMLHG